MAEMFDKAAGGKAVLGALDLRSQPDPAVPHLQSLSTRMSSAALVAAAATPGEQAVRVEAAGQASALD
jgi:hypothetical protein